jgi:DNA polymerase
MRIQTVFGTGNPHADLVFVGEAPGAEEDRQGEPFVGRAGQLLTDIIEKGIKIRREDVYICNVLKCRPPENRDPNPEEVVCCEPYLLRQLELIQPKVICALGRIAAQTLLRSSESTTRLRGKWHNYHGIPFRVTYHPAYLLRSPGEKRKAWEDIQEVMKVLNGQITPDI